MGNICETTAYRGGGSGRKPALCYIIPEYRRASAAHFAYLEGFLGAIAPQFALTAVIEKGERPAFAFAAEKVFKIPAGVMPIRAAALLLTFLRIRLRGCRRFYVHYSFLAAFLAKLVGGRVYYWNCGEPWKYRRPAFREWFERFVYRRIDYLVTGTGSLADQYAAHYGIPRERVRVMPNWIDLGDNKWQIANSDRQKTIEEIGIKENQKIVLFIHRLSKRKGAHYLPEIVRGLRDEDVVVVVVGDGPERADIESRVRNDELGNRVRFLGWVPHDEAMKLFQIANVFIMPSEEEGFPHVLLEAMAAGVPYTATLVGGVEEITPPELQPYLVPAGDVPAIVRAARTLLKLSVADREALGRVEMAWVEQFRLERVADIFKQVVGC